MDMSEIIYLIGATYTTDSIGQYVKTPTRRKLFCSVSSVTQSEFFEAGRNGLKAQYRVTVPESEYHGEQTAELRGEKYGIYRTYSTKGEMLELYLEKRAGS